MSKLFSNDYLTIRRNVRARWDANEERHQKKRCLLWGIFNDYIKQNIVMVELKKNKFSFSWHLHMVEKSIIYKKIKKTNSNLIFFLSCKVAH